MAEVEPMKNDGTDVAKPTVDGLGHMTKTKKRKRTELCQYATNPEEKEAKIKELRAEIDSLVKFCKDKAMESNGALLENEKAGSPASLNCAIACLMEESNLTLSKLVDEIFDEVKGKSGIGDGVTKAIVKSSVLKIGQRLCYGVTSVDADILEDETEHALWCWETRNLKLMPKLARPALKVRRTSRRKIQERILAVLAMILALEKLENYKEFTRASEKLSKVLNEGDIHLLMNNMSRKNSAEMAEKEAKREEKLLLKQMEKSKMEMEKEKKKVDRELQKEKLQSEKELKRLHDEAEKEKRMREKEESEMQKKLKKQQEEAVRCQKRKEKEETELRNQLALQKQASLMERFLKRKKGKSPSQNDCSMPKEATSVSSNSFERSKSITQPMDSVLAQIGGIEVEDIWKSHLNTWRCTQRSHLSRNVHWGIRQKPKTELIKELKLTTNKEVTYDEDLNIEKLVDGWADSNIDGRLSEIHTANSPLSSGQKRFHVKQLLQFDKSHRPAFYGIWPTKSQVVGPRHPFVKDSDIDYEVDSDEEWEEDEPGESLSDCDKDEDVSMEDNINDEDEDENDGFFVPDGYLSENEGLSCDEMECDDLVVEVRSHLSSEQSVQSEEFCALLRQQKYLNSLTEHSLKKNQPLIILNLMHEKTAVLPVPELTGAEKLERICLQALSICSLPGFSDIEISIPKDLVNEDQGTSSNKLSTATPETAEVILDSDLPKLVSTIQTVPHSISKMVESLHTQFPAVPKSQLRKKVHEVSEFSDNRWQVRKEVMIKLGLSISPGKGYGKVRSIATYLKRCLPPSREIETTPQSSQKSAACPEHSSCEQ